MALKIAVLVKEVPDLEVKVGVSDGGTELEVEDRNVLNFFDELAVEEAVRIRESGLAAEKGLNTPRVPQVMGVMKAMKVQVPTVELEELGVEAAPELRPRAYHLPPERPPVKMLEGEPAEAAAELVRRLREEAGVL